MKIKGAGTLVVGDIVKVQVERASAYDPIGLDASREVTDAAIAR